MMKKIRLSHSAADKYTTCPALYFNHYILKLRPYNFGSALPFGSAIDEALNYLLFEKKKKLTEKEQELKDKFDTAEECFVETFKTFNYNHNEVDLIESDRITYFKSDLDMGILEDEDFEDFKNFDSEVSDHHTFIEECFEIIKNKEILSDEDRRLYNYMCYKSLYRKGLLLIEAYRQDILPQIHTVFDIQKFVELPDENGNRIIGYIDAIVSFIDSPKKKVILDNKTSSKPYADDSVRNSPQLSTYCENEGIEWGAYGVVEKKIRKRVPKTRTQLIIDKIPEETFDKTFEMYDNVLEGIQNEEFDRNFESGCFFFGSPCSYYGYCKSDGKYKDGLEEL